MEKEKHSISELSKHLFWDCTQEAHDWEQHAKFIVKRVLQYGLINDWKIALNVYGVQRIALEAMKIRNLDPVTLNFISTISDTNIEHYTCYIERQSHPTLWNS